MRKNENYLVIFLILFLGALFQFKYINDFPSHKHAWAQSDRYALSLGFVNNGLNFFKPETYVLNKQFEAGKEQAEETNITAVDFPIHDYIPAIFMKISGSSAPWIFRLYIILYSCIGLFALFKLSYFLSGDYLKSILVVLFAATSPVFVYYQGSFLPTIPSLANSIIGIYFYARYMYEEKNIHFNLSLLFITLAALSRTTFVIPLIAILSYELLRIILKESKFKAKILPVAISLCFFVLYYLYNNHLREIHGSVFLSSLKPASSIQEAFGILKLVWKSWGTQYFSRIHYLVFFIVTGAAVYMLIFLRKRINKYLLRLGILTAIILTGCLMFAAVMLHQYKAHDYYFLDTFFLPLVLFFTIFLSFLPDLNLFKNRIWKYSLIILLSIPMVLNAYISQNRSHISGNWNRTDTTIKNYADSEDFLDSLGISKDSKMLVIDAYAPNIPLVLMDRKGYVIMSTRKESIEAGLLREFDHIVLQNEFFLSDIYTTYPEILSRIEKIADNGKISICRLVEDGSDQTLFTFLGLEGRNPVFSSSITYDSIADESWQNTSSLRDTTISSSEFGVLSPDMLYGLTYKSKDLPALCSDSRVLLLTSLFLRDTLNDCDLVVSLNEKGENIYYKSYNLRYIIQNNNTWEEVRLLFQLPMVVNEDYELAVYLWNKGRSELLVDDFTMDFY